MTTTIGSGPPVMQTPECLQHRGIAYSTLSGIEKEAIRARLPSFCHTVERLEQEGYVLKANNVASADVLTLSESFLPCPVSKSASKHWAILLDCEMAEAVGGRDEVIRITIVDFLSGKTLVDNLVNPSRPITDWREEITGINANQMREAVERNETLAGWKEARLQLWRFADERTIIVGQSVQIDLKVLHVCHATIVDSAIITADAVLKNRSKVRKRWGLVMLSRELAGIEIRTPQQLGGPEVHDALEDALATREVLLTCVMQPRKLKWWAYRTRVDFFKGTGKGTGKGREKIQSCDAQKITVKEHVDTDEEHLTWDDVVDPEAWPKSPPDSD